MSEFVKIDPLLREKLCSGDQSDIARVILTLSPTAANTVTPQHKLKTSKAYRAALLHQKKELMTELHGPTRDRLRELGLNPQGGEVLPVIVVEGPLAAIAAALEIPGIVTATLDRAISLIQPVKHNST